MSDKKNDNVIFNDPDFADFLKGYEETGYPGDFTEKYILLECLSERTGTDTFLVQDPSGRLNIAKSYNKSTWSISGREDILKNLVHPGLPGYVETLEDDNKIVIIREYIEGTALDRYMVDQEPDQKEIVNLCIKLCDIIAFLHHRDQPVIHRDIKPQNVIVTPEKDIALIDFDIARIYHSDRDTDTVFFGTRAYAPPEQYGFAQTDARTDIYSFGILLRYLLTGSPRNNKNIRLYRPLEKIIKKCTAFDPKERYTDIDQVKKALQKANPRSQRIHMAGCFICGLLIAAMVGFGGYRAYKVVTYDPFNADAIPKVLNDQERITDAVDYLNGKYNTDLFDSADELATVGLLRTVLINLYGLDRDYVYAINNDMPHESPDFFLPWGWDDDQFLDRENVVYAAIKVHDPELVADWSSLKDDNGYYPGCRVAEAFAQKCGIMTGANRPKDITVGELALIFANTDRVFDAADQTKK
ncbi:MAG: serine/threonine protein kinase [Eubacterium sp.]|nr:serine/threonine protein kinase [Eubacterium sp.]